MHLSAIHVYPIKSCAGTPMDRAAVGGRGLEGDRRWMLVDRGFRFLSQRDHPRMALIEPDLGSGELRVRAPGVEDLSLERDAGGRRLRVEIWRDRCEAVDHGDEAAEWFTTFLGIACRLVRQADDADRAVDPAYAREPTSQVSFADGYPFLLTTEASLDALNARLAEPVPMDRFRPNLVVAGSGAFAEDGWRTLRIGELELDVVKPCARCVITTVDQATGRKGREPLRTLADFRRDVPGAAAAAAESVYFGQNLIHRRAGVLDVGAAVEVLAR
jgi:uncharacterized protein